MPPRPPLVACFLLLVALLASLLGTQRRGTSDVPEAASPASLSPASILRSPSGCPALSTLTAAAACLPVAVSRTHRQTTTAQLRLAITPRPLSPILASILTRHGPATPSHDASPATLPPKFQPLLI
jgi:hypothetical protein